MAVVENPKHIYEPTSLQCGQAVLSMLSGKSVEEIVALVGTERETTLKDMKSALIALGIEFENERKQAFDQSD